MLPSTSASTSKNRRVSHITRACDKCRKRRIRCNGAAPCATCTNRGWDCQYAEEDRRRSSCAVDNLRTRVTMLETMLGGAGAHFHAPPVMQVPLPAVVSSIPTVSTNDTPAVAAISQTRTTYEESRHDSSSSPEVTVGTSSSTKRRRASPEFSSRDRLKRYRNGPLVHFGPTSIWTHDTRPRSPSPPPADWHTSLPPSLTLTEAEHASALEFFGAYYAPWCLVVDMPAFVRDMSCAGPAYSALLHCSVLVLGLSLHNGGGGLLELWKQFEGHVLRLMVAECASPSLSSLRGLNLLASSLNFVMEAGYIFFGLSVGALQALGLNVSSEQYLRRGQITEEEHNLRAATYWTMYVQDVLRAIGAGRPPLLPPTDAPLPQIDPSIDMQPWLLPSVLHNAAHPAVLSLSGLPSLRSTVFHYTAKLIVVLRAVLDTLYSVKGDDTDTRTAAPTTLVRRLASWRSSMPVQDPTACPLPHVLLLHLSFHLVTIYLYRPFYRSPPPPDGLSSAERCNAAASTILSLLQVYDELHGLQHGPLTLSQVIFGCATVFLLKAVGEDTDNRATLDSLEECLRLMGNHAKTWDSADAAFHVLALLRSEWLQQQPATEDQAQLPDLQEWLVGDWFLNQDLLDLVSQWDL